MRLHDCERLLRLAGVPDQERERRSVLLFVLSGPGVHADLVQDRGLAADEYERWLAGEVRRLLVP